MKKVIGVTATAICLLAGNIALAGNCSTHSVEKVKCDMAGKTWDETNGASASTNPVSTRHWKYVS